MPAPKNLSTQNRLLAALPSLDRQRFTAGCKTVDLEFGETLIAEGETFKYVYFPVSGFISLIASLEEGHRLEVGLAGIEGMLGKQLAFDVTAAPLQALVQGQGTALRMGASAFRGELERSAALREVLHRYVYVAMNQLTQLAICIHYHRIEMRLARWLLMTRDRALSNEFRLTHEFLSLMLGVRRVGITEAAGALQSQELIHYHRGTITILDEVGLEKASCGCYRKTRAMYESAFPA